MLNQKALQQCEGIYQRHRNEVVIGEKNASELLQCAKGFVDLEEVSPVERLSHISIKHFEQMMQTMFSEDETLKEKVPEWTVFVVKHSEKNREYYQDGSRMKDGEEYLLILERHSVYFSCTNNLLYSRLRRASGISLQELEARGAEFCDYMTQSFLDDPDNPHRLQRRN